MVEIPNANRRALEWNALCFLCAHFENSEALESSGASALNENHFVDPVHRALFLEISHCRARGLSRDSLRLRLPEALTRLGWPDLDFESLFSPPHPDADCIRELLNAKGTGPV